jgi:glutathione S-transferase
MEFLTFLQVPAFETTDGQYLTESNAIAYYGK